MNRIKGAYEVDVGNDEERYRSSTLAAIHKHTYGVTSDPLTLFSCVYSALIHDANHPGVPNLQLIKVLLVFCTHAHVRVCFVYSILTVILGMFLV